MNWLEVTDNKNKRHLINADNVVDVIYHSDTNLSEIVYLRSGIAGVWVNGNILTHIKKAFLSGVIRVGD